MRANVDHSGQTIVILVAILTMAPAAHAQYGGGSGTVDDPYLIYTPEQLNAIGADPNDWGSHFVLMADLDLAQYTDTEFNVIGADNDNPFTGTFDGNGRAIAHFSGTSCGGSTRGLFGTVDDPNARITDLHLTDPNISGGNATGALAARLNQGQIEKCTIEEGRISGSGWMGSIAGVCRGSIVDCHATSRVTGRDHVGGLVGHNFGTILNCGVSGSVDGNEEVGGLVGTNKGTITDCEANCAVSADLRVGGLIGINEAGILRNCYATGTISGAPGYVMGGLVGESDNGIIVACDSTGTVIGRRYVGGLIGRTTEGRVSDCYANASVEGNAAVGGLIGDSQSSDVIRCYASGTVTGQAQTGGLMGLRSSTVVTGCFWDTETSGQLDGGGGTGLTTAQMQDPQVFMAAGWDFFGPDDGPSDLWTVDPSTGYPISWWQVPEEEWPPLPEFAGGTGAIDDPYLIASAEHLNGIGNNPRLMDASFQLTQDIDVANTDFYLIGSKTWPFTGTFDGNDRTISNFTYSDRSNDYLGLFRYVDDPQAEIRNLGLVDPNINSAGGDYVGALVGRLNNGTLTACHLSQGVISGSSYTGGIVGYIENGTVTACHVSRSTISGYYRIGALIGHIENGTVTACSAFKSVVSGDMNVGGLVGYIEDGVVTESYVSHGRISGGENAGGLVGLNAELVANCYAYAFVAGAECTGGLVGKNANTIMNCYATGLITGAEGTGGLVGYSYIYSESHIFSDIIDSFWDVEATGQSASDGGTGLTTAEMMMAATYLEAEWDFIGEDENGTEEIWWIDEGQDYPRLWWEL